MKLFNSMRGFLLAAFTVASLSGCMTTDENAIQHNRENPGSAWSGTNVVVKLPGNLPGIPESNGKAARFSQDEVNLILHLDASCQEQINPQIPGYVQAMAKEGLWGAATTGPGEAAFSLPFAGAEAATYGLGGLGYGAIAGANTGRIRQDQAERVVVSQCGRDLANDVKNRYQRLQGIHLEPWVGNGETTVPVADKNPAAPLPYTRADDALSTGSVIH